MLVSTRSGTLVGGVGEYIGSHMDLWEFWLMVEYFLKFSNASETLGEKKEKSIKFRHCAIHLVVLVDSFVEHWVYWLLNVVHCFVVTAPTQQTVSSYSLETSSIGCKKALLWKRCRAAGRTWRFNCLVALVAKGEVPNVSVDLIENQLRPYPLMFYVLFQSMRIHCDSWKALR